MSIQKGDYRTNRADYAIAAMHRGVTAEDSVRDDILAARKKSLWLKERRSAKSAENPLDSSPLPKRSPRG
ncbi:hypothetical protein NKH57_16370 [Mesorhizobium sp. M1050]|uniref:hypothetical protein n=1 Tax=unclassified Mesorhizobium TaxID=325217 RepID=UPI0009FBF625|nr:hypothetical protein [Mesorhizobium sp. LNHC252B00]